MADRSEQLMIRINGDMKSKFASYANEHGMTMSAMAAYVIGAWVRQQDANLKQVIIPECINCNGAESPHSVEQIAPGEWQCHECNIVWWADPVTWGNLRVTAKRG